MISNKPIKKKNDNITFYSTRINLINYTVPQVAKANLGGTEEQLRVIT